MRRSSRHLIALALTAMSAVPLSAQIIPLGAAAPRRAVGLQIEYLKPRTDSLEPWYEFFLASRPFEANAEMLNREYRFDRTISVKLEECGFPNAQYDPETHTIEICYEYAVQFARLYNATDPASRTRAVLNTLRYTFFHEVGHAMIDVFDLPNTSNEEEAADFFAAYTLLNEESEDAAYAIIQSAYTKNAQSDDFSSTSLADEHPLNQQRYYNLLCWVLGSNPARFGGEVLAIGLPANRARRCPGDYAKLSSSWTRLLKPHRLPAQIPELGARILAIKLYDPLDSSRTSKAEFEQHQPYGIAYEIELSFPTPKKSMTAMLACTYRDGRGAAIANMPNKVEIRPGWSDVLVSGIGSFKRTEDWPPGKYYIECKSPSGDVVQSEEFSVR
jgi:hypothetical protein